MGQSYGHFFTKEISNVWIHYNVGAGFDQRAGNTPRNRLATIVNLERVVGFDSLERGDSEVVLSNGQRLKVSRHYHDVVARLGKKAL